MDLDGDIDAASGSNTEDRIEWYEDDCGPSRTDVRADGGANGAPTPLDDTTIRTAVAAWLADATAAEATYGHISTWERLGGRTWSIC